jgi:predicted RNase H-like nuclease
MTMLVGVDGCTGGWIAAIDDGSGRPALCRRFGSFSAIMALKPEPSVVAIDVPIGLLERGTRDCDAQARRLLAERRNSVFTAPIRATLQAHSHSEASAKRFEVEGKKISLQAWGIICKINEVDAALQAHLDWRPRVCEVHPELCFYHLNAKHPMEYAKRFADGKKERLELLRDEFGTAVDIALASGGLSCKPDDVIDAFVSLWTARRIAAGSASRLPAVPPRDHFGLPMEMWA